MPCAAFAMPTMGANTTTVIRDGMAAMHAGTCFCGAVVIAVTGVPVEMGYCHCESCRSYSGAPVSAFILWKAEDVTVTKGAELIRRFNKTGRHWSCQRGAMRRRTFITLLGGAALTA